MKTSILFLFCLFSVVAYGQFPPNFTWRKYVSPVDDQLRQGPCFTFASVGGVETMHALYFGTASGFLDLSERQVYSCGFPGGGVASIQTALEYINLNGAVTTTCVPYASGPGTACDSLLSDNSGIPIVLKSCSSIQNDINNCTNNKKRVKVNYQDVTNDMKIDNETIKSVLVNKGPIILSLESSQLHSNTMHAYLLYGWMTSNNTLYWLLRDSWPCKNRIEKRAAINIPAIFNNGTGNYKAFVITQAWEERYSNGWYDANLAITPFELESDNQIVKINEPSNNCYKEGTYTLSNMNLLPGTVFEGWSLRFGYSEYPNFGASINSSGYLSGHADAVTVVATIRRPNGLREYITKNIGPVGVPFRIEKRADWCPTQNQREIHLLVHIAAPPNCNCTSTMNFPPISNGYIFNYGSSAVIVSTASTAISYNVQISCQKTSGPSCPITNSMNPFVIVMPCGGYYREAKKDPDEEEFVFPQEQEGAVFPNPAEGKLVIRSAKKNNMRLINSFGNTVYQANFTGSTEVDISLMTRGIYIVELVSDDRHLKRLKVVFK
jgi:hypothetical protein